MWSRPLLPHDGSSIAAEEDINYLMNALFQHTIMCKPSYHHSANPGQNPDV